VDGINQLAKGQCRIEKNGLLIGHLEGGDVFGELSFLRKGIASASIVANSGHVLVYHIPRPYIDLCFMRHDGLSDLFFEHLAGIIASRLRAREGQNEDKIREWERYRGRQERHIREKISALKSVIEENRHVNSSSNVLHDMLRGDTDALGRLIASARVSRGDWKAGRLLVRLSQHVEWRRDILEHGGLRVLQDLAYRQWPGGETEAWTYAVYALIDPSGKIERRVQKE